MLAEWYDGDQMDISHLFTWLDCHAGTVQALCAVVGLIGLYWYCFLTFGIHRSAISQTIAATCPFIVIDELNEKDVPDFKTSMLPESEKHIFIIRNLGNGPAFGIQWAEGSIESIQTAKWIELGDLGVGDWSQIPDGTSECMYDRPSNGMIFRFSDVAENNYETIEEYRAGVFYQKCRPRIRIPRWKSVVDKLANRSRTYLTNYRKRKSS